MFGAIIVLSEIENRIVKEAEFKEASRKYVLKTVDEIINLNSSNTDFKKIEILKLHLQNSFFEGKEIAESLVAVVLQKVLLECESEALKLKEQLEKDLTVKEK